MHVRRGRWAAVAGIAALVLGMSVWAVAADVALIEGQNGHTATKLFDEDDVRALSSAWDREVVTFGDAYHRYDHWIAGDEGGAVYVIAKAEDLSGPSHWIGGVLGGDDADSLDEVLVYPYGGGTDWTNPRSLGLAEFSVGEDDVRIDEGDIVLLCDVWTGFDTEDEAQTSVVVAFDPTEADPTPRVLYEADAWIGGDLLLDTTNQRIVLPVYGGFVRLDYDEDDGVFLATTVSVSYSSLGGRVFATDGNGALYTERMFLDPDRDYRKDWLIAAYSTGNGALLDDDYADPIGAPNNYANHDIQGFAFAGNGKLWLADFKKNKSPDHFIAKANNKGKFPYKKRVAGWSGGTEARGIAFGLDGMLYAIGRTGGFEGYAVYAID